MTDMRVASCCLALPTAPAPPSDAVARMHRYAGHDARALARALGLGPGKTSAAEATRGVNLPDAWGNTLLHTACATRGASEQVALLLRAGADIHACGPYGMPPLAAAWMARQWRAAHLVAARGGSSALGRFNEVSERSLLANVFGVDGVTRLHGRAFELEGAFEFGVYPRLADAVAAFADTCADTTLLGTALWHAAVRALRDGPLCCGRSGKGLHARARAGIPMLLPTGWRGHSVCVAILGNAAVRANRYRARGLSRHAPLRLWRYARSAPEAYELACLRDNRGRGPHAGGAVLRWLDTLHRPHAHDALARTLARLPMKPQKANNCAVANAKAGLWALLLLLRAQDGVAETRISHTRLRAEYKRLTTFVRMWFLERYRAGHAAGDGDPPDMSLVRRCEAKLATRVTRHSDAAHLHAACRRSIAESAATPA